ncbi:hypothetical protein MCC93_26210 [Morococcus cerebrosus]|uniref:Uncharacterized protein n=1 Tax=Morococcus cerebrosus TaxID=1056807 RepID=A0A0C1GVQ0_9NEIS|nr:hypothetical protein MCC93_26210 [Morococcus cerebrosus]
MRIVAWALPTEKGLVENQKGRLKVGFRRPEVRPKTFAKFPEIP